MEKKKIDMDERFTKFYSELCNIIDKSLCEVSGFSIPEDIPSTSPEARNCSNKIIELLEEYHGNQYDELSVNLPIPKISQTQASNLLKISIR